MKKLICLFYLLLSLGFLFSADTTKVEIKTNYGSIELEVYQNVAPKISKNFIYLVKSGFYNKTYFHRVIPSFMIQGGDPNTKDDDRSNDGKGGTNYKLKDEINADSLGLDNLKVSDSFIKGMLPIEHPYQRLTVKQYYTKLGYSYRDDLSSLHNSYGYISMANRGPNTNGSQFFIITAKNGANWLDGKHTVFGRVVKGMEVVHMIENLPKDEKDNPKIEVQATINSIILK